MELAIIERRNPIVAALQSTGITELKKTELVKQLVDILTRSYYESGLTPPGGDKAERAALLHHHATEIAAELKAFPYLRIDELRLIFNKGVRREFGDYYNFSVATIYNWLKAWQVHEHRRNARAAIEAAKQRTYPPVMTREEAEAAWRKIILRQFATYKAGGELVCHCVGHQFKKFEKMGLIKLSNPQKWLIYERALTEVVADKAEKLRSSGFARYKETRDFLNRAKQNALTDSDKLSVKQHAQYLAIKQYYDTVEELVLPAAESE